MSIDIWNKDIGIFEITTYSRSGQSLATSHDLGPQKGAEAGKWDPLFQGIHIGEISLFGQIPGPSKGCQLNPKGWWIDTL